MISTKSNKKPMPTTILTIPTDIDSFPVSLNKPIIPKIIPVMDAKIIIIKIGNADISEFPAHELKKKNIIPTIKAIAVITIEI